MKMSLRRRIPVPARCSDQDELKGQKSQIKGGTTEVNSIAGGADIFWQDPECPETLLSNDTSSNWGSCGKCDQTLTSGICAQRMYAVLEGAEIQQNGATWTKDFGDKHVYFDVDEISDETREVFAWKQTHCEEKMRRLHQIPEKIPHRKTAIASSSIDNDRNQNHFPGGGPPLSGSAMRNNLLGAIQLKRTTSIQPEEKFDPTKSIGNLRYEGPKEDPEPTTSQAVSPKQSSSVAPPKQQSSVAPPKQSPLVAPPKQKSSTGGNADPMKNLLGAIQLQKPETDFVEEKFDPTKSIPNLSYQEKVSQAEAEEKFEEAEAAADLGLVHAPVPDVESEMDRSTASSFDEGFVTSRSVRIMNNQSSKDFTPPNQVPSKPKPARNSQTQTQGPPSLTSLLSAATPERQASIQASRNTGVDNSVSLVRPSLVRFSQQTKEHPVEAVRGALSRECTRSAEFQEGETILSSHNILPRESMHETFYARPLMMLNEDNTIRTVKYKHELRDILRDSLGDEMPDMPRELQNYIEKFQHIPLNKVMHYAETGSYLRESYVNSNICDIRVHVGQNTIPAHRIVLACFSPYLASVLENENPLKQKKPKDIRISGVSEESVKILLNYVYTGELQMESIHIPDFIKLAEKFDVSAVRQKCFDRVPMLSDDELVALLSVMKDTHDVEFCDCIMKNIASKFMRVRECKAFLHLDADTLCLILQYDALILRSEMDVFYSCLNWLQNGDTKERNKYLDRVMDCVRFPLMNHTMLYECVERCNLLKSSASCIQKIHEANWLMTMSMLNKQDPLRLAVPSHRNNVNSSASVSDYITRTCSRVKSDVTVEVAREGSPVKTYYSAPANVQAKQSPSTSRGGTRNNNADSIGDDEVKPGNQLYWENADLIRDSKKVFKMDPSRNHTIIFLNKRMYIIGGCNTKGREITPRREVLVYDKICGTWVPLAPLLTARMYHSLCAVKGQIYAIGGIGEDYSILNSVECFDPSSNCWYFVKSLTEGRMGACAAEYGGQMYVAGGYGTPKTQSGQQFAILDSMECYNPHTNKWIPKRNLRYGRCHANLISVGQSLYLFGGVSVDRSLSELGLGSVADVDEYDVTSDTWMLKHRLLRERHDACCVKSGNKLYLVGGISTQLGCDLGDIECLDPQKNTVFTPTNIPRGVHWITCATSVH